MTNFTGHKDLNEIPIFTKSGIMQRFVKIERADNIANEIATLVSSLNDKAIKISDAMKSITFVITSPIIDFLQLDSSAA